MEANDMAAMREALVIAKKAICNHARANHTCDSLAWENSTINANCGDILCGHRDLCEAKTAIQKAISKPPRNCDVGSVAEQKERFKDFCKEGKLSRIDLGAYCAYDCPCRDSYDCKLEWAQMPYEERKGDEP